MDIALEYDIRQRAYAIWVATGMNEGDAEAHWLRAERAVRSEAEAAIVSTAPIKGKAKRAKVVAAAKSKAAKTEVAAPKSTVTKTNAAPRRLKVGPVEAVA